MKNITINQCRMSVLALGILLSSSAFAQWKQASQDQAIQRVDFSLEQRAELNDIISLNFMSLAKDHLKHLYSCVDQDKTQPLKRVRQLPYWTIFTGAGSISMFWIYDALANEDKTIVDSAKENADIVGFSVGLSASFEWLMRNEEKKYKQRINTIIESLQYDFSKRHTLRTSKNMQDSEFFDYVLEKRFTRALTSENILNVLNVRCKNDKNNAAKHELNALAGKIFQTYQDYLDQ